MWILYCLMGFFSFLFYLSPDICPYQIFFIISLLFYFFVILRNALWENVFFFFRNAMLISVGALAALVKVISSSALFSAYNPQTQTLDISQVMVVMTNFALISSQLGFWLSRVQKVKVRHYIEQDNFYTMCWCIIIFIIFSTITLLDSGGIVLYQAYGTGTSAGIEIGVSNVISAICLLYILFYRKKYNLKKDVRVNVILYGLFLYFIVFVLFLHGARLDALDPLLGVMLFGLIYFRKQQTITLKMLIMLSILYVILQLIGAYRYANFSSTNFQILSNLYHHSGNKAVILNQGTLNDIANTFSGVIYIIKQNMTNFQYGETYWGWIARIPPQFIYPGRPVDPAWIFPLYGLGSGGGFFELAEVYYNFGLYGALFVPLIFSYLLGRAYYGLLINKLSTAHFFSFFSVVVVLFRGGLYQNFAWYKAWITGMLLYVFLMVVSRVKKRIHSKLE